MSMALEMCAGAGALHVTAAGKFSLAEAKRTFVEMIGVALHHKADRIFFDGRRLDGDPERMERFYFGEFAARTVVEQGLSCLHFAYVLNEPLLDPARFGETVAVNRGMNVRAFDNVKEARQWLGIAPANEPSQ